MISAIHNSCGLLKRKQRDKNDHFCIVGFSSDELVGEIRKLERFNSDLEDKIQSMVELINNMDDDYQCSKNDVVIKRYLLLKLNLKSIFENQLLQ